MNIADNQSLTEALSIDRLKAAGKVAGVKVKTNIENKLFENSAAAKADPKTVAPDFLFFDLTEEDAKKDFGGWLRCDREKGNCLQYSVIQKDKETIVIVEYVIFWRLRISLSLTNFKRWLEDYLQSAIGEAVTVNFKACFARSLPDTMHNCGKTYFSLVSDQQQSIDIAVKLTQSVDAECVGKCFDAFLPEQTFNVSAIDIEVDDVDFPAISSVCEAFVSHNIKVGRIYINPTSEKFQTTFKNLLKDSYVAHIKIS